MRLSERADCTSFSYSYRINANANARILLTPRERQQKKKQRRVDPGRFFYGDEEGVARRLVGGQMKLEADKKDDSWLGAVISAMDAISFSLTPPNEGTELQI